MRSAAEIKDLIISFASRDERVRAVLLNGSRVNPIVIPDEYQDFDIVFFVTKLDSFLRDHNWTSVFGQKIAWQLPDEMVTPIEPDTGSGPSFGYLMLFEDGIRIDLTLFPLSEFPSSYKIDSLSVAWLDKDGLFSNLPPPSDTDYRIAEPTQKEFTDTCNEFWWVCTNVSRGLLRGEVLYARDMLERYARPMFLRQLEWYAAMKNGFSISMGKSGKFISRFFSGSELEKIYNTCPDHHMSSNWNALFLVMDLFSEYAKKVSAALGLEYNDEEDEHIRKFISSKYSGKFT